MLDGDEGELLSKAMRLLVTLGETGGAKRLARIRRSQVAGVSYKTAGEPTLELLESFASTGTKVKTIATLNPAGMDLERWAQMGISAGFAEKQRRICRAYERLGIRPTCTCTPYLSGNRPAFGEIVGFSESSAVAYSNSVLGARSNRHGGLDALAAALVGRVPLMGYLLDENRLGDVEVRIDCSLRNEADYAALGYFVGKNVEMDEVPVYPEMKTTRDRLKLLGAASAASGSVALYHVLGFTPEARKGREKLCMNGRISESIVFDDAARRRVYEELSCQAPCDLVAVGCPHCSLREVKDVADRLRGKRVRDGVRLWVFVSPKVFEDAKGTGCIAEIEASGAKVFEHTCMVVAPLEEMGITGVTTNSAKAAFYVPRMTNNKCGATLLSLRDCVSMAKT
jgi:predicted aconitase